MAERPDISPDIRSDVRSDLPGRDVPDTRPRDPADFSMDHQRGIARERSIGELLKELRDDTTTLLRQEVALAKTEMSEKASRAGRNAAYIAAGGAVAYAGLIFLLLAATYALYLMLQAMGMETHSLWVAPLIVGAIVGIIGYSLVQKGISTLRDESLVPEKTTQSLQEDKQWLQEKTTR
jgi:hypothetical protein